LYQSLSQTAVAGSIAIMDRIVKQPQAYPLDCCDQDDNKQPNPSGGPIEQSEMKVCNLSKPYPKKPFKAFWARDFQV
jgi:hypothetical protein